MAPPMNLSGPGGPWQIGLNKFRFKGNLGSESQKVSEILRFDNIMGLRFRLDLTHKNGHNSLNF